MLVTGEFVDAETARAWGLVNRVVPDDQLDEAVARLVSIASKSPAAVAIGKDLFYRQLDQGMEAAYAAASDAMTCNMLTEDAAAGIDALIAKQPSPKIDTISIATAISGPPPRAPASMSKGTCSAKQTT